MRTRSAVATRGLVRSDNVVCLAFNGAVLTTEARNRLYCEAWMLAKQGKRAAAFNDPGFGGVISTEFKRGSIGTYHGTIFTADLVTEAGTTDASFLVPDSGLEADLEKVVIDWDPVVYGPVYLRMHTSSGETTH